MLRLNSKHATCVPPHMFDAGVGEFFGIQDPLVSAWRPIAGRQLQIYQRLADTVNSPQSSHLRAYEIAVSIEGINTAPDDPKSDFPSEAARSSSQGRPAKLGVPYPFGQACFQIEALLQSILLRSHLSSLACSFSYALTRTTYPTFPTNASEESDCKRSAAKHFDILNWAILLSCRADAILASNLCRAARMCSLGLVAELTVLHTHLAFSRFVHVSRFKGQRTAHPAFTFALASACMGQRDSAAARAIEALARMANPDGPKKQISNFEDDVVRLAVDVLLSDWQSFAHDLRNGIVHIASSHDGVHVIEQAMTWTKWSTSSSARIVVC